MKRSFKQFLENQAIDDWLSLETIEKIWDDANEKIFNGQLTKPKFTLEDDLNYITKRYKTDGEAVDGNILGFCDRVGSRIVLQFSKKIANARELLETVVHEMVHQAEAERTTYLKMHADPHGDDFFAWADQVKTYHGLNLRTIIQDH
jgi:hypothetical protein